MLYDPIDLGICPKKDVLVDSGAYLKAVTENKLIRIKQQAPINIFKIDISSIFQI